jgi:hypothetical protein|tara:strand:+ start:3524 stop:3751 length:228 start_codon:yes stop_codon:yes gene_type:complete
MEKKEKVSVWKFNDDEWKIHITSESLKDNVQEKFNLGKTSTIYYENGSFQEETSWDIIVPNKIINKVKKYIKDNS